MIKKINSEKKIKDIKIINYKPFKDVRGSFTRLYCKNYFSLQSINFNFVQVNLSTNINKHTLRGLHYQKSDYQQSKLVRVSYGEIQDIIIDIRKESPTFGEHISVTLSKENGKQLFVPKGFAHGFLSLEKENIVLYSCSNYRDIKSEDGIVWNDKMLKIKYPVKKIKVSQKDKKLKTLQDFMRENKSL